MKKVWIVITLIIFMLGANFVYSFSNKVNKIDFGKYGVGVFYLYQKTNKLPKDDNLVSAVVLEMAKNIQCKYKIILESPRHINNMLIWDFGVWRSINQNGFYTSTLSNQSIVHSLKGRYYLQEGYYTSGEQGGFIRGVYSVKSMPIGNYKLYIYIDNVLINVINFKIFDTYKN